MKAKILLSLLFFSSFFTVTAQSLYEVTLTEKTVKSSLIIEGKVVDQTSFWNAKHTMIYSSSKVEIYKIFKGSYDKDTLEIITEGGSVGYEVVESSETLRLYKNQSGVFFLFPNSLGIRSPATGDILWDVYSSSQGFIHYDLGKGTASAPFIKYRNIMTDLYNEIKVKTRKEYINKKPGFSVNAFIQKNNAKGLAVLGPSISSFSPAIVNAGALLDPANNVLTINGAGFGTGSGSAAVLFDDADDGSGGTPFTVAYNDPLIISWSNTQIQLRVPTKAGTGALIVQDAASVQATAPSNLEVLYSIQTASFSFSGNNYTKEVNLIDDNSTGGYTIFYSTNTAGGGVNFDTDPAKQTFQRALTTWKETAGYNITEGGTTNNQASNVSDGVNTIMFDNLNTGRAPLAAGVLATCYSFMTTCPVSFTTNQIEKTEFDVVIRNAGVSSGSATFTNGPCPPNSSDFHQTDLESVILHELGHAINLGHINDSYQGPSVGQINPNKLMNYAIVNSVRRTTPDYSAKAGALYAITPQGSVAGSCTSMGEMTPLSTISESKDNCPASFPSSPIANGTTVSFDLVHAGSNRFVDPGYTQVRCDGLGASITNNAYYAFKTNPAGGILSLVVSGYSTTPAALASCPQVYGGVPVTGIRLALYQASSCPSAGAFSTPVTCQIFSGNGTLPNITGLSANTNYLLYLEGVENTKAAFSLTFGGSVLPIKFQGFTGKVVNNFNELNWSIGFYADITKLVLEKSANGIDYYGIDSISANNLSPEGNYNDNNPLQGNNFYRLAAINNDGSKQFSSIVVLARDDHFLATLYPNPASTTLNIQVSAKEKGRYAFDIYNSSGQTIHRATIDIVQLNQVIKIPLNSFAKGVYFLKIRNDKSEMVQNSTFTIAH